MISSKDLLFGKIAIRKRFVTKKKVRECLRLQRRQDPPKPLGQILLERGYIDFDQLDEVLYLQRKAQKAGRMTGRTHVPLFGRLAIQRGFCTWSQINECLREQQTDGTGEDKKKRQILLGQLLIRKRYLTVEQFMEILRLQEKVYMVCGECGKTYNVAHYKEGRDLRCRDCGGPLARPAQPDSDILERLTTHMEDTDSGRASGVLRDAHDLPVTNGEILLGNYVVEEKIAKGAMGVVYRARHKNLDRVVALKVLQSTDKRPRAMVKRFVREGQAIARLDHPGIVKIYDWGHQSGVYYYAMDLLEGRTLDAVLADGGPLSQRDALRTIEQIAEAIHAAHEEGIVHRDLKPQNIMQTPGGDTIVMDFGLAKALGEDDRLTRSGEAMGTPYYMSPEQARGEHRRVDARSDVYSLGVILYELLTGRVPFKAASSLEVYKKIQTEEPTPPRRYKPSLPEEIEAIVLKCLQKSPDDRYDSAEDLADDIQRHLSGSGVRARRTTAFKRAGRRIRRNRSIVVSVAVAIVSLASAGGFMVNAHFEREATIQEEVLTEYRAAIEGRRFDDAERLLARLVEVGAPEAVLVDARSLGAASLGLEFERAIADGRIEQATDSLARAERFDIDPETAANWARRTTDAARASVERLLESGDFGGALEEIDRLTGILGTASPFTALAAWARGEGTVVLRGLPSGLTARIEQADESGAYHPSLHALDADGRSSGLRPGSYRLRIDPESSPSVFLLFRIERDADGRGRTVELEASSVALVPRGMTLVGPSGQRPAVYIDVREVTVAEYRDFLDALPPAARIRHYPGFGLDDQQAPWSDLVWTKSGPPPEKLDHPITHVHWADAVAFARAAGKRLPTVVEWRRAARGNDDRPYPWGRTLEPDRASFGGSGDRVPVRVGRYRTGASPHGCLDMAGNVQEWLADDGEAEGEALVAGGCFDDPADAIRTDATRSRKRTAFDVTTGFRCVRTVLVPTPGREVEDLLAALGDASFFGIRHEAARQLADHLDGSGVVDALLERSLEDPHPEVRYRAVTTLVAVRDSLDQTPLAEALRSDVEPAAGRALEALDRLAAGDSIGILVDLLRHDDASRRLRATSALLRRRPAEAVPLYRSILTDESVPLDGRLKAAFLLGLSGGADGPAYLLARVDDLEPDVKLRAAYYLWYLEDARGLVPMLDAYASGGRIEGIGPQEIGTYLQRFLRLPGIEDEILRGLDEDSPRVQATCARLAGMIDSERALGRLRRLDRDGSPEFLRKAAAEAIALIERD